MPQPVRGAPGADFLSLWWRQEDVIPRLRIPQYVNEYEMWNLEDVDPRLRH